MSEHEIIEADRRPIGARNFRWSQVIVNWLSNAGVTPNSISVVGMLSGVGAGALFYLTGHLAYAERAMWIVGAGLIMLRLLANMLDGMVAVETGISSSIGELYNEIPDRISDAAILIGAGYAVGGNSTLGYIAVCVALFVAYVRSAVKTAGAPSDFCGPMAKQQRMHVVAAAAVFMGAAPFLWHLQWGPDNDWGIMAAALLIVIVGGVITAVRRVSHAVRELRRAAGG